MILDKPCDWYGVECTNGHVSRLQLSRNGLNGFMSSSIEYLINLKILSLDENVNLGGAIPESIGRLRNLRELYLDHSNFSGAFPQSVINISLLKSLWLSGNHLRGLIPDGLRHLNIKRLSFCGNDGFRAETPELEAWLNNIQPSWNGSCF